MARKPKYESVEQIEGLIEAYFESCKGEILRDEDGRIVFNQKDGLGGAEAADNPGACAGTGLFQQAESV